MAQPIWITPPGSIGIYPSGSFMSVTLVAEPVTPATSVSYQIIAGILIPGLILNTTTGVISGIPTSAVQTTSTITVRATDNLGNIRDRTFTISMVLQQPNWITTAGSIGTYSSLVAMATTLAATPVLPATSVTYQIITGSLSPDLTLNTTTGVISGIPDLVTEITTSAFTVRVTDNLGNIRDRTFTISILGQATPEFTTANGSLIETQDSLWIELPVEYNNPDSNNPVAVRLRQGSLPPGLEINAQGVVRGYARPPTSSGTAPDIVTYATATDSVTDLITVVSTVGFTIGRPVTFTGTPIGGLVENQTYYVKFISSTTQFSVSVTQNGSAVNLNTELGFMTVNLPNISTSTPLIRTYSFTLELTSPLGGDTGNYSITVINQNTPKSQDGPGNLPNTRSPVILNTRPLTYLLTDQDPYYGYYILPPVDPSVTASIGTFVSGEYFAFKVIGHDFDGNDISYAYSSFPPASNLVGNTQTGWITGTPKIDSRGFSTFNFSVSVYKTNAPSYTSATYNFSFNVRKEITDVVIWRTNSNLGNIYNGSISDLAVAATSDTILSYRITEGSLPPNLTLADTGDIIGRVADQPTDTLLAIGDKTVFTFTVQAYSSKFVAISSSKTFTLTVVQAYDRPTETLYIKAAPPLNDRQILRTLLDNDTYIRPEMIYRPNDIYFGKATSVIYEHAYGIYASDIERYLEAIKEKNYYWRYITLGEIKTAVAKNSAGEVIYEVVYSEVIDDLVNPNGISVPIEIVWPRPIPLNLGDWYTSRIDVFTSYIFGSDTLYGDKEYFTALTPGTAQRLYPNSLYNMRTRISIEVGQDKNSNLLPHWMTSQQADGNTLGYTQAWVICYTKPGFANIIKDKINTEWPYKLNAINFQLDRFTVDKSATYNYDTLVDPHQWTSLPSATPPPDPLDSKDFYVLFPRKTILPDKAQ